MHVQGQRDSAPHVEPSETGDAQPDGGGLGSPDSVSAGAAAQMSGRSEGPHP